MKNVIFAFLLTVISVSTSAFYRLNANCFVNNRQMATCQVCNYTYYPARCQMNMSGRTYGGVWVRGFQNLILRPGQCSHGYVRANNPYFDPLMSARANVFCN